MSATMTRPKSTEHQAGVDPAKAEAIGDGLVRGAGRIAGVFWRIENLYPGCVQYRMARINGEPGLLRYVNGTIESAQSFLIEDGRIVTVFIIRNPDKLTGAPQHFSP